MLAVAGQKQGRVGVRCRQMGHWVTGGRKAGEARHIWMGRWVAGTASGGTSLTHIKQIDTYIHT